MDKTADLKSEEQSSEEYWFRLVGVLCLLWLPAYLVPWFTFDLFWGDFLFALAMLSGFVGAFLVFCTAAATRSKRILLLGVAMAVCLVLPFGDRQTEVRLWFLLLRNESRYLAIVEEIKKSPATWNDNHGSREARADVVEGTVRVAFELGGFFDDIPTLVHDSTQTLTDPNGDSPLDKQPFRGSHSRVRHLRGPWFFVLMYPDVPPEWAD
jgi:hypothetical protein